MINLLSKIKATNIASHLQLIWQQTFVAIHSETCETFSSPPPEVAVLFDLNLSRYPVHICYFAQGPKITNH